MNSDIKSISSQYELGPIVSMNLMIVSVLIVSVMIVFTPNAYGGERQSDSSPIIEIKDRVYDFGLVADGVQVIHDFLVQNNGTSVLEIQKVKTG